jgi:transposase-like protein
MALSEQLCPRWPKLADLMDASEHGVLAYMAFPRQHRTKLRSANPIDRLNKEVKRRADTVGIFPDKASIMRLIETRVSKALKRNLCCGAQGDRDCRQACRC